MSPSSQSATDERTIWKFTLAPWTTAIEMPAGARLLHAPEQDQEVCVWAEVDPGARLVIHRVAAIPTGGRVAGECRYIGTAHIVDLGQHLVFHVYDRGEPDA